MVLLKDSQAHRNEWPIRPVVKASPISDSKVRKVEVRIAKDGKAKVFLTRSSEIVVLFSEI